MNLRSTLAILAVCLAPALAPAADQYKVDPMHSSVFYRVKHLNLGYSYGRFNDIGGTIAFDEAKPADCSFDLEIKADSLDTANPKRDQHLKGPDFFNVKEFPTITFKSKQVKQAKERTYEVTGDLTLHGVTKSVTINVTRVGSGTDPWKAYRTGFEANFSVKRGDFGMNYMPGAIGEDVWILVAVEGVKQ